MASCRHLQAAGRAAAVRWASVMGEDGCLVAAGMAVAAARVAVGAARVISRVGREVTVVPPLVLRARTRSRSRERRSADLSRYLVPVAPGRHTPATSARELFSRGRFVSAENTRTPLAWVR